MRIEHTEFDAQYPWPDGMFLQGGECGVVIRPADKGGTYRTAFVEAFPGGTFIRGEGSTVLEAETACWLKYQRYENCPGANGHDYEPRNHRNGAGFCKHCGRFASKVFSPEQLGCFCKVCGVPTFWARVGEDFYCDLHHDTPEVQALRQECLQAAWGTDQTVTGSKLGDLFAILLDLDDLIEDDTQESEDNRP